MPRVLLDECDNPLCHEVGRREEGLLGPEGWLKVGVQHITADNKGAKTKFLLAHRPECAISILAIQLGLLVYLEEMDVNVSPEAPPPTQDQASAPLDPFANAKVATEQYSPPSS